MTYELVKQLKDSGFKMPLPQEKSSEGLTRIDGITKEEVYFPTLSELIEACGKEFGSLLLSNGIWGAKEQNLTMWRGGNGATPEEAVANLWLKLNQK